MVTISSSSGFRFCRTLNEELTRGKNIYWEGFYTKKNPIKKLYYPKIGIYAGEGTSHSWIWVVETLEKLGFYDLTFADEKSISSVLPSLDFLIFDGGTVSATAYGLGKANFRQISEFIRKGGVYIGICGGACLSLSSSKEGFSLFNMVETKIFNIMASPPAILDDRYCIPYGCEFVYHPVRGPLMIRMDGREIIAPLYGGPSMVDCEEVEALGFYDCFTSDTTFLVDKRIAEETLIGKVAVLRKRYGDGLLYLFGPHFEHPLFPEANLVLAEMIFDGLSTDRNKKIDRKENLDLIEKKWLKELKKEISNSMILSSALEAQNLSWEIGRKVWEPEKIMYFLRAIWKRLKYLERNNKRGIRIRSSESIIELARTSTESLRAIKRSADNGEDTINLVEGMLPDLKSLTSSFFDLYFTAIMAREAF